MKAQFTKADGVDDLTVDFSATGSKKLSPQAEADYLNHLLLNHIPASTYNELCKAMNEEPK